MNLIFGQDAAVAEWVGRRIDGSGDFGACTAIGVSDGVKPVAGVVYNNHDPTFDTLMINVAADDPRWAQRGILLGLLSYPFEQLNVRKLWAVVNSSNKRAIKFDTGLGFRQEAILSRHFGRDHAVVLRMFKADYARFKSRMSNGQKDKSADAA